MYSNESETIEFKTSFGEWKEIIISLSAFANKNGVKLLSDCMMMVPQPIYKLAEGQLKIL